MRAILCLSITVVGVCRPLVMRAQDPVIKPAATPGIRLPAPKAATATQEPDGRIRVVWSAVPGASAYTIVRSVPPAPVRALTPNPTDTVFFDSDVTEGSTYYYVITALNDAGAPGMRVGSPPLKAVRNAINTGGNDGGAVAPKPSTNVVARMDQALDAVMLTWDYGLRPGLMFIVEGINLTTQPSVWRQWERLGPSRGSFNYGQARLDMERQPEGTQFKWRVSSIDSVSGARSTPTESNVVTIVHPRTSCTTGVANENVGAGGGVVRVHTGATASVRVGATFLLTNIISGAVPTEWISFDPQTATVSNSVVTGRSPGCAQILGVGRSHGSISVTLFVVTVQP